MKEMFIFIIIIIIIINRCWRVYLIMSSSTTSRGCSPLSPSPLSLPPSVDTSSKSLRYLVGRKWVLINYFATKILNLFLFLFRIRSSSERTVFSLIQKSPNPSPVSYSILLRPHPRLHPFQTSAHRQLQNWSTEEENLQVHTHLLL